MRQEYLAHGFSADHVTRLPPVYPSLADGTQARVTRRPTQASDTLRLGFVGRVEHLKGLHVLLESLPIVRAREPRPILVTVAGDGPELARCRVMAERIERETRGVRCNFVGWASQQRCVEIVDGSDVLVVPSLWPEPFGLTGAEAVQRGVPVAAFRVGAIPEWLIDGENGGLAPSDPPTAEGLASAILRARDVGQRHASAVIGTSELRSASAASWLTTHVDALLAVLGRAARGVRSSGRATTKAVSGGAA
jgi:glycosyltransferase involved in cell wall biosynthesis